ncbi:YlxR family protein [Schaalia sp. 19OD2882]|nr:YlxR family protein [Schaalia sp. 19OD2882]QWW18991.1 YlxR family protein [Schaalia sp. 19OD2882]
MRTCVGCGARGARSELIRIAATPNGSATVDPGAVLPGRGAWVHADLDCLTRAQRRKSLTRALRLRHEVGEHVWEQLHDHVMAQCAPDSSMEAGRKLMGTR